MAFPSTLTGAVDGVTEIIAAHLNNLEEKVGVDGSAVVSSLDYLLKNVASIDPGHKHDHGGLQGLADDDHPQYIKHSLGTAIGDLIVASGVGAFTALPDVAVNNVLLSGGVGAVPAYGKVPLAAMADMATGSLLGRNTAGAGIPEVITDIPTAITIGGAYVYRVGGTDVAVADGGTNLSAYTAGDLLYASAADALSKLAGVAVGQVLVSGGVGAAPAWSNAPVLSGDLSFGANDGVRVLGIQRRTTAGQPGYQLTVKASGSAVGSTDQDGGTLVLRGGQSTGAGLSRVQIQSSPAGASGTDRRAPVTIIDIEGNKMGFFGATPVVQPALLSDPAADTGALATWAASINDYLINLGFMASA